METYIRHGAGSSGDGRGEGEAENPLQSQPAPVKDDRSAEAQGGGVCPASREYAFHSVYKGFDFVKRTEMFF